MNRLIVINNKTKMYLRYFLDESGKRVYTFKFHDAQGDPTVSAHPGKSFLRFDSVCSAFLARRCLPDGAHEVQGEVQLAAHAEAGHQALIN